MGTGITDVIGGPHDFLPLRSNRSDEFQKLCNVQKYFAAKHLPLPFQHYLQLYSSIEEIYANGRLAQFIVDTSYRLIVLWITNMWSVSCTENMPYQQWQFKLEQYYHLAWLERPISKGFIWLYLFLELYTLFNFVWYSNSIGWHTSLVI